jgi:hypothetical protein
VEPGRHLLRMAVDVPRESPPAARTLQRTFGGGSNSRRHTCASPRRFGHGLAILESGGSTRDVREPATMLSTLGWSPTTSTTSGASW